MRPRNQKRKRPSLSCWSTTTHNAWPTHSLSLPREMPLPLPTQDQAPKERDQGARGSIRVGRSYKKKISKWKRRKLIKKDGGRDCCFSKLHDFSVCWWHEQGCFSILCANLLQLCDRFERSSFSMCAVQCTMLLQGWLQWKNPALLALLLLLNWERPGWGMFWQVRFKILHAVQCCMMNSCTCIDWLKSVRERPHCITHVGLINIYIYKSIYEHTHSLHHCACALKKM